MSIVKGELNDVVRQCLHFLINPEAVPENVFFFLSIFEVQGIEAFRNGVVIAEGLLSCLHGESSSRADFDHQQFVISLVTGMNIVDLTHVKNHAILPWVVELEALLANSLYSVGASQFVRPEIYFRDDEAFVLFLKLAVQVGVHNRVHLF